jgi:2-polyprenyl-6-methoxyphenol hydroxylase-like FAD-dependent oxidoreductase
MPARLGEQAVVVGGSVAGLLAARVLATHYRRVTILDRDRLPAGAGARKGTPQARHIHVLLTAGRRVVERLYPGFVADVVAAGAEDYDAIGDVEWYTPAGPATTRFASGLRFLGATRDLIEWGVRTRTLALPGVAVRDGVSVAAYRLDPTGRRVVGVVLDQRDGPGRPAEELAADLVVDASGRGSRTPQLLESLGFPRPRETVVNGFLGYASRLMTRPAGWTDWTAFHLQAAPPHRRRGGVIAPVEGGRWVVTLAGGGKDYPPTDEAGFRDFARSLPDPRFAAAVEAAEPLSPIVGTKTSENRVRHYEEHARRPEGLLVMGDAACAFNPVYGQGMTAAAVGAEVLDRCLCAARAGAAGLAARFQVRLARANTCPWLLATGEDYRFAEAEGPPPGPAVRLAHWYLDRITALAAHDPAVRQRFVEVVHLVSSPVSLLAPGLAVRTLVAGSGGMPAPIRTPRLTR